MGIRYVDGKRFSRAVMGGAGWVRHMREHLNRINVFPVADGDTGTNMALSLSATAAAAEKSDSDDLGEISQKIAEASILGAKGNSGLILAHWFLGLSKAVGRKARVSAQELATAFSRATEDVYLAIDKPVEGTILTVMREGSDAAAQAADQGRDVRGVLDEFTSAAEAALKRTPEMLAVLKEHNVVDAGAQGFVHFLQGVRHTLEGKPPPELTEEELHSEITHPVGGDEELDGRFCTEVVVRGRNFDPDLLKARFAPLGSSMLVATTGDVFKLHIHTDHPDEVFKRAAKWGTVEERKVDDMLRQQEERAKKVEPIVQIAQQPSTVAILCDSTADLPLSMRQEYGIEMVPLSVLFGDEVYRDQIDLSTDQFYRKLVGSNLHPTTSQPPPREFLEALERLRQDREAIIVTVSSRLSGTYRSAISGAGLAELPRVSVFDSGTASLGLGMQVLGAARMARTGASTDEILSQLEAWHDNTGLVFTVATLDYLKRGGRIGRAQHLLGSILGVRPILTFEEGEVRPVDKARGEKDAFDKVIEGFCKKIPEGSRIRLGLIEGAESGKLDEAEALVRERFDVIEALKGDFTGVVGAHTGPGAWGLFYQKVDPDDPLL